ncbi:MAG: hypothetical protein JNM84_07850, partial [Planctomycetes bacterium]|nr:hypothetical protein [Planctomycetota bacterium]
MSDRVRARALSRAARPLLFLVLLSLAAPWLASDQPLWVRGASRAAWERCEEQLVRALLARDPSSFARAREEALLLHLAEDDALRRLLAADDGSVPEEPAGFRERDHALAARRPEVLAEGVFAALDAERALLDLALEPALRRLPRPEELLVFAARIEASLPRLGVGALSDAARAVAVSARDAASRGERRLTDSAAEESWRALRDGLDRWRAASASERRALLGASEPAAVSLRSHVALPAFARAARAEVLLWGGLCGFAIAA